MKYGESLFDICYLLFAIISGCIMLKRSKDATGKLMGYAALILGCGDAFHLVPRVLNYFVNSDFTVALGVGKLVTSITMTVFYVLVYYLWIRVYGIDENRKLTIAIWFKLSYLSLVIHSTWSIFHKVLERSITMS